MPVTGGISLTREDGSLRTFTEIERDVLNAALTLVGGNMTELSRHLGIGRSTLYRKLSDLDRGLAKIHCKK
jgi:transcriptional regulator of acetoin/glycerol metabolism